MAFDPATTPTQAFLDRRVYGGKRCWLCQLSAGHVNWCRRAAHVRRLLFVIGGGSPQAMCWEFLAIVAPALSTRAGRCMLCSPSDSRLRCFHMPAHEKHMHTSTLDEVGEAMLPGKTKSTRLLQASHIHSPSILPPHDGSSLWYSDGACMATV